ncbi:FeS assembly protein IscX [Plasmodium falciparum Santa Lucia]|uniref:FeS assembly protein IscX n=5 Tax=Plasmodium falciparum TaxID=5833 RepID=A0A024W1R8_PLAFA|nr:FeS assembly protein IscX [Plasmodium falciparum Vietnam Oak-Knoll (FVO)]ETW34450.1 FeS assembly protein IscX [Plasmodium falciparum Tanzania (2000708)]ETW40773.1 FeS assembly protein IscX [Plasmodium falciparum NF135/5.C10]EUR65317.1 FeS assembly protein IscX [Plasmodium falciparum 7G8]EUT80326.1 FeS assembly protein IscX [Plasmodium falciparum Santa Lucia]
MISGNIKKYSHFALKNGRIFNFFFKTYRKVTHCYKNNFQISSILLKFPPRNKRYFSNNDSNINKLPLHWENAEDIADMLFEEYRNIDPLTLRFEQLENMIIDTVVKKNKRQLNGHCNEGVLENIQMNWLEKYNEEND